VLLWAKNRKAGASVLAGRWARELGRPVSAAETSRELNRLGLTAGPDRSATTRS
jgi:hypothetical protein